MVTRRPTSSQFKRTSRQVQRATIKSQLPSESSSLYSRKKKFSDTRRARTAQRGEIHQVMPATSTRESRRSYESRMGQSDYLRRSVNKGRKRKAIVGVVLGVAVLVVACVAAAFVYVGNIDSRLAVPDKDALSGVLAPPADAQGTAEYTILAASYDDPGAIESIALVRTDAASGQATVVAIPGSVQTLDGSQTLSEAYAEGGDAGLAQAVEEFAGIQAAHYARTDANGLQGLVDAVGGITVTLDEEVSDPDAGDMTLPAGAQTIDGQQALFLCRANDFSNPDEGRAKNMAAVAAGLLSKVSASEGLGFYLQMDHVADFIKTDMDVRAFEGFVSSLRGIELGSVLSDSVPIRSKSSSTGVLTVDQEAWTAMMGRVNQGLAPKEDVRDIVAAANPSSFTITVNNGGGVEGAAAQAAQMLQNDGFSVSTVGNTAMQVYDETLVIYKDEAFESQAEAVVALLGHGRAVWDSIHYSFDTDVLVVIGSDWGEDPSSEDSSSASDDEQTGDAVVDGAGNDASEGAGSDASDGAMA